MGFELVSPSLLCCAGIRNEIITKGKCVCGATNVLADDLLPNRTLRDAIDHFLESQMQTTMTTSSGNNAGSRLQVQGMLAACINHCSLYFQVVVLERTQKPLRKLRSYFGVTGFFYCLTFGHSQSLVYFDRHGVGSSSTAETCVTLGFRIVEGPATAEQQVQRNEDKFAGESLWCGEC